MITLLLSPQMTFLLTLNSAQAQRPSKFYEALPFDSAVNTWGDEIYFTAPAQIKKLFTSLRAFSKLRERSF